MVPEKEALRRELIALRRALSPKLITIDHLSPISEFSEAEVVFCYVSAHGEVDTHGLICSLLREKTVVVPYCTDLCGNMICVKITSPEDLITGKFGIPEPKNPVIFPKEKIQFALVPGIAFDKNGYRLGYGKGYYDRFLKDISPFMLGVCGKEFYFDALPHDEFDVKMNSVLAL